MICGYRVERHDSPLRAHHVDTDVARDARDECRQLGEVGWLAVLERDNRAGQRFLHGFPSRVEGPERAQGEQLEARPEVLERVSTCHLLSGLFRPECHVSALAATVLEAAARALVAVGGQTSRQVGRTQAVSRFREEIVRELGPLASSP